MTASITRLFYSMRDGETEAAQQLVHRLLPRLRGRLSNVAGQLRLSDEDDIAISAFYELCKALEQSQFEDISDRTELWRVLSMIAIRKANDFRKYEMAERRGGSKSAISLEKFNRQVACLDEQPELQFELLDLCEHFLQQIKDGDLKEVTLLKMNGHTNKEISNKLGLATRTVQLMVAKSMQRMLSMLYE